MKKLLSNKTIMEFMRYVVVGGLAFIVDFIVLYLFREFVFQGSKDIVASTISVAVGFIVSFIFNYFVSLAFVFTSKEQREKGNSTKSFVIVLLIAGIGFLLTEVFMYIGEYILDFDYKITKVIVAGIVLVWNYVARKKLVFK